MSGPRLATFHGLKSMLLGKSTHTNYPTISSSFIIFVMGESIPVKILNWTRLRKYINTTIWVNGSSNKYYKLISLTLLLTLNKSNSFFFFFSFFQFMKLFAII